MNTWEKAQKWEQSWWGTCVNTFGEEEKQLLYANRMGLRAFHDRKSPYNFDMGGKSVLDIGGGPCSLLLKCTNVAGYVIDPILAKTPKWVLQRYAEADIDVDSYSTGEDFYDMSGLRPSGEAFDEAWIYNVLQHAQDPALVIATARKVARLIRIFEWIDTPTNEGHPHTLTESQLNEWLGGEGKVAMLTGQANCHGKCYYGVFPTESWDDAAESIMQEHAKAWEKLAAL